jgi:hypothetical protein
LISQAFLLTYHAAARWNFANLQTPTFSAVMMEFTTPPSYGSTVVNVGGLAMDGKLVFASAAGSATHTQVIGDPENDWPEPGAASYKWVGVTEDGNAANVEVSGSLGSRLDRVDVMAEVPKFVKQIVATAAGTKPYIYQYGPPMKVKVTIGDEIKEDEGILFTEATFIS